MKSRRLIISSLSSLAFSCLLSISLCVGWFYSKNAIDVEELTGSVLKKYFEDGDGSEDSPFEIARPKQYENFIKLHYEMEGFAERGFYFVFGHNFGDSTNPNYAFYTYSDSGVFSSTPTNTLNLTCIGSLPPLGSDEYPFSAKLNGNNLTVANFTVAGTGYADIGIFGYVSADAVVTNCYFSNFTIDMSEGAYPEVLNHATSYTHQHDENNVYLGYLAGHLADSQFFTNVYVNNCKLIGQKQNSKTINNYGYYGKAEIDSLGGQTGVGNDYKFTLNADACYSYLNSAYDTFKEKRLLLRNTQESVTRDSDGNVTSTEKDMYPEKVGAVFTKNDLTYSLNGSTPSSNASRTYSLSTTGFRGYPMYYEEQAYDVVYSRNGTNYVPAYDALFTTKSLETLLNEREDQTQDLTGDYIYYNSTATSEKEVGWRYMHASARYSTESETKSGIKLSFSSSYDTGYSKTKNPGVSSAYLYIDKLDPIPISVTASMSGSNLVVTASNISLPTLKLGEHHVAIVVHATYQYSPLGWGLVYSDGSRDFYYGNLSGSTVSQKTFLVTNYMNNNQSSDLNNTSSASFGEGTEFSWTPTAYLNTEHFDVPLLGARVTKNENGTYSSVSTSSSHTYKFENSGTTFEYVNNHWYANQTVYTEDTRPGVEPVDQWIGDSDQLKESGYSSDNIDVVGGNVQFYSNNLLGQKINVISVPSESNSSSNYVRKITNSDLNTPFYAPSRCLDSVVLYIKNTANARDNRDDLLGKINFTYATIESLGSWIVNIFNINIGKPVFKKGNKETIELSSMGTTSTSGLTMTMSLSELRESDIKKASLCALDKNGNIIGSFDSSGNPSVGFSGADEVNLKDIDRYVVAIGCYSSNDSSTTTWVTNIDFSYKAEVGYGGTFGSVGYRSANDTIENTILNFAIIFEESSSNRFEILVYFVKDENGDDELEGVYHIEAYSDSSASMNVFNYYPDKYDVYIKLSRTGEEQQLTSTRNPVDLPGGTY